MFITNTAFKRAEIPVPPVAEQRSIATALGDVDALIAARADLVLETTLATRAHARRLKACRAAGYRIALIYLRLPDVEASIARVRRRVERGGHGIPEATLRRRFPLSLDYLETVYKPLVDEWEVWASGDGGPELLDWGPK